MAEKPSKPQAKDWSKEIELVDSSDFHKDRSTEMKFYAKRTLKAIQQTFFGSTLGAVKTLAFFITAYFALNWRILELWLMFWGVFLVFDNLGKRQKGTLSAYSVFNKNFERPIGYSEDPYKRNRLDPQLEAKKRRVVEGTDGVDKEDLPPLYFNKIGKFGNKECYCGSLVKYKKCCYTLDLKFGPHNQARISPTD